MKKILFYGDSNTYGYDPRSLMGGRYPEHVRWTGILKKRLAPDAAVFADGMNGRSVPASKYVIVSAQRELEHIGQVDLFAVMLGSNDLLHGFSDAEEKIRTTASRLEHFLRQIAGADQRGSDSFSAPARSILLISPLQIEPGSWGGTEAMEQGRRALSEAYRKAADQNHWNFIDSAGWHCELSPDGVHMTETGHRTFAEKLEPAVRDLL